MLMVSLNRAIGRAGSPTTSSSISASSPPVASSALSVRVPRPEDSRPDSAAWLRCRIVIPGRCPSAGAAGACTVSERPQSPSILHSATSAALSSLWRLIRLTALPGCAAAWLLAKRQASKSPPRNLCHATAFTHPVTAQQRQDAAVHVRLPSNAEDEALGTHNLQRSLAEHLRRGAESSGQGPAAGAAALLIGGRGFLQLLVRVLQERWQLLLACTPLPYSGRSRPLRGDQLQERQFGLDRQWLHAGRLLLPVSQQLPARSKTPDALLSLTHTVKKAHATMEGGANLSARACQHKCWVRLCMCKRPCLARRASPAQRPSG